MTQKPPQEQSMQPTPPELRTPRMDSATGTPTTQWEKVAHDLYEKGCEIERELSAANAALAEKERELANADHERREANIQATRDAARADANAAECGRLNAALEEAETNTEEVHKESYSNGYKDGWRDGRLPLNNPPLLTRAESAETALATATAQLEAAVGKMKGVSVDLGQIAEHMNGSRRPGDMEARETLLWQINELEKIISAQNETI